MFKAALPALVLGTAVLGTTVFATTILPMSLDRRVRTADRVVIAQVMNVRTELQNGDVRKMFTHTDVIVGDVLKGPASGPGVDRITVTQLGGKYGSWEAHIPGDATFAIGETVLLLLRCSPTPKSCGLVGLNEGKVPLLGDAAFVFDLSTNQYTKRPVAEVLAFVRSAAASTPATGVTR